MGDVKTTTKKDSRTATPAPPRFAASDPLTDPLGGGAQEHLADPLTSGGEGAVQMEGGGVLAGMRGGTQQQAVQTNVTVNMDGRTIAEIVDVQMAQLARFGRSEFSQAALVTP